MLRRVSGQEDTVELCFRGRDLIEIDKTGRIWYVFGSLINERQSPFDFAPLDWARDRQGRLWRKNHENLTPLIDQTDGFHDVRI